jgi:hypothetical protein
MTIDDGRLFLNRTDHPIFAKAEVVIRTVGRKSPTVWYSSPPPKLTMAARRKLCGFARAWRLQRVPRTE